MAEWGTAAVSPNQILADLLLAIHASFILFVVVGLILIWAGWALHWSWVRHFWFRLIHLLCIAFVAVQSIVGAMCPLTVWEDRLRGVNRSGPGFIERHLERMLYYDFPDWVFMVAYAGFGLLVLVTFVLFSPKRRKHN